MQFRSRFEGPWATPEEPHDMRTGGWRSQRPITKVDKCRQCGWCFIFCPSGCIEETEGYFTPNLDYCKGGGICSREGYRYLFLNHPTGLEFVNAFVRFLDSLPEAQRPTKVALFEEQTDLGLEGTAYAQEELASRGYKFVTTKYQRFGNDLSPQILAVKNAGADAMYSTLTVPDGLLFVKQMKQLDFNSKAYMVMMATANQDAWKTLGKDGDYMLSPKLFHWSFNYPGAKELSAKYEAENGEKIVSTVASCYSTVQVLADVVRRAGSLNSEEIRDALATTDMMTVTGRVKFAKNGKTIYDTLRVVQFQNGMEVVVFPENAREKPPIYPMPKWKER